MMMMIWYFTYLSTLFKSYQDDEGVMKGSVNEVPYGHEMKFSPLARFDSGPLDQESGALNTQTGGHFYTHSERG